MERYSISNVGKVLKIYINDVLHICVKKVELVGIQSWLNPTTPEERSVGFGGTKYVIEITTQTNCIKCEYDTKEKWESILKLLDKHL